MNRATSKILLTVMATLVAAAFVIGNIGDSIGAWNDFADWLFQKIGLPTDDVALRTLLFVIAVILLALLIHTVRSWDKREKEGPKRLETRGLSAAEARATYLHWFGKDVENRLKSSVHWAHFIELEAAEAYDAVLPWHYKYQDLKFSTESKALRSLQDVLDQNPSEVLGPKLLILGGPGSGKTTTLLDLARRSHLRAVEGSDAKIPVLVNLSLWGQADDGRTDGESSETSAAGRDRRSEPTRLEDWLVARLADLPGAGVSRAVARQWMDERRLLLLLDGLDEASEASRRLLVVEINRFLAEFPTVPVVVCSRSADYEALVEITSTKLRLDSAVTIEPLTPEQIDDYLEAAEATRLRALFEKDSELREMASNPLELSLMVVAYADATIPLEPEEELLSTTARRMHLFGAFVDIMMQRKARRDRKGRDEINLLTSERLKTAYSLERIHKTLGWLAQRMSERSRTSMRLANLFEFLCGFGGQKPLSTVAYACALLIGISTTLMAGALGAAIPGVPLALSSVAFGLVPTLGFLHSRWKKSPSFAALGDSFRVFRLRIPFQELLSSGPLWLAFLVLGAWGIQGANLVLPMPAMGWFFWGLSTLAIAFIYRGWGGGRRTLGAKLVALGLASMITVAGAALLNYVPELGGGWALLLAVSAVWFYFSCSLLTGERDFELLQVGVFVVSGFGLGALVGEPDAQTASLVAGLYLAARSFDGTDKREIGSDLTGVLIFTLSVLVAAWAGLGSTSPLFGLVALAVLHVPWVTKVCGPALGRWVATPLAMVSLKAMGRFPLRTRPFIDYCVDALLLKRSHRELEFVHRRIRDFFALRDALEDLSPEDGGRRKRVVRELFRLRDASCDVLLELVEDRDKEVRLLAIEGLGEIGTALAAQTLLKVHRTAGKGLRRPAAKALEKVRDLGAIPQLLRVLSTEEPGSELYEAVVGALDGMDRLEVLPLDDLLELLGWDLLVRPDAVRGLVRQRRWSEPRLEDWIGKSRSNQQAAATALNGLAACDVVPAIVSWISRGVVPREESRVIELGKKAESRREVVRELSKLVESSDLAIRSLAVEFLAKLGATESVEQLAGLLPTAEPEFSRTLVRALIDLGARHRLPAHQIPRDFEDLKPRGWRQRAREVADSLGESVPWKDFFRTRALVAEGVAALESNDSRAQLAVLEQLEEVSHPKLRSVRAKFLDAEAAKVRDAAAAAIGRDHLGMSTLDLAQRLTDDDPIRQAGAKGVLTSFGEIRLATGDTWRIAHRWWLLRLTLQMDSDPRRELHETLRGCSEEAFPQVFVRELLKSGPALRKATIENAYDWSKQYPSVRDELLGALEGPDPEVRAAVLKLATLQKLQISEARLVDSLSSSAAVERLAAVGYAAKMGIVSMLPRLIELFEHADDLDSRGALVRALRRLSQDEDLESLLLDVLAREPQFRQFALDELCNLGSPKVIARLLEMTYDTDHDLRSYAIEGLGKIGHGRANERLLELLDDSSSTSRDGRICDFAAEALEEIGTPSIQRQLQRWRDRTGNPSAIDGGG